MSQQKKFGLLTVLCGVMLCITFSLAAAQETLAPVGEAGSYQVGIQIMALTDESRDDRNLQTYIWYPALVSEDAPRPYAPDDSGAPYPLVIFSHGGGGAATEGVDLFIEHLVSQGFVVAGVDHRDPSNWQGMVDRPLDVLFLLNQLADLEADHPLAGIIDTSKVGVIGSSFGGYTSLALGGGRVNPTHLLEWCADESNAEGVAYCGMINNWDELSAYHDQVQPASEDNLWIATTDERIAAVLPMVPCMGQAFTEAGLESVAVPTLIIAGTLDSQCPRASESDFMYAHVGAADRYLVTIDRPGHIEALEEDVVRHYATSFFGYYLQGKADYAAYLTPESAEAFGNLEFEATLAD